MLVGKKASGWLSGAFMSYNSAPSSGRSEDVENSGVHHSAFLSLFFQIYAVRSVVPNKSNNEIVLVLQQFDFNVDKAVQAFVDGRYACPPETEHVGAR